MEQIRDAHDAPKILWTKLNVQNSAQQGSQRISLNYTKMEYYLINILMADLFICRVVLMHDKPIIRWTAAQIFGCFVSATGEDRPQTQQTQKTPLDDHKKVVRLSSNFSRVQSNTGCVLFCEPHCHWSPVTKCVRMACTRRYPPMQFVLAAIRSGAAFTHSGFSEA